LISLESVGWLFFKTGSFRINSVNLIMGCIASLCLPRQAPRFTIEGTYLGRVTRIYDGDTWHIIIKVNGKSSTFTVRLAAIDTPELRHTEGRHKEAGIKVRDYCRMRWDGKRVKCVAQGLDKYGRLLATIYPGRCGCGQSANSVLLSKGYALPYSGGTKTEWSQGDLDKILGQSAFLPF